MKLGVRRTAILGVVTIVICFFGVVLAFGQAAPQRPAQPPPQSQASEQKAEDVFKNIQVMKGISVKELMEIIEEVNIVRLHAAAHDALKKIAYAVDLTPAQIYEVFTDHRGAPLEDLCKRLHEKSLQNRSKF